MYTAPPPAPEQCHPQAPKDLTASIAQRLYDHFSQMRLNAGEWLACLEQFLVESDADDARDSLDGITAKISRIITQDKSIPLDRLSEENRQEMFREVAEWLVAEKICEKMVAYEPSIREGLEKGAYRRIHSIEEVMVVRDDDIFHGSSACSQQEIKDFILQNYVIRAEGEPLGRGARVEVRELAPVRFPLPYPTRDERKEGLMLLIPNNFLVIRILNRHYRDKLGANMDESELDAIDAFKLASELLVYTGRETSPVSDISEETSDQAAEQIPEDARPQKTARRTVKHSFMPPLIIIKAVLEPGKPAEYLTIQKKVARKGEVGVRDSQMAADLNQIKGLKKRIRDFISSCKRFHRKEKMLPDTVGHGNVLYTARGNVYLVDINNITEEPDFEFVALVLHYKKIYFTALYAADENKKSQYADMLGSLETEIRREIGSGDPRRSFSWDEITAVVEEIYSKNEHPAVQNFLRRTKVIDDLGVCVYLHNLYNLRRIEDELLTHDLDCGTITENDYRQKCSAMAEEPIYRPISLNRGGWRDKRSLALQDIAENKQAGLDNWIAEYVHSLYCLLSSNATMA